MSSLLPTEKTMELPELKAAMEAVIFVAEDPVSMARLKEIFPEESYDKLETAILQLMQEFNSGRPGLEIREIAGGYCMRTRPEHHEAVRAYLKTRPGARLSLPALETLAVVAYRQPITMAEIMAIRGIKSSSAIKTLLEKKLIDACGRKKVLGRPILYGTTKQFLLHFGLKDLKELPSMEEFEEFLKQDYLPQTAAPSEVEPLEGTSVAGPEPQQAEPQREQGEIEPEMEPRQEPEHGREAGPEQAELQPEPEAEKEPEAETLPAPPAADPPTPAEDQA